MSRAWAIFAVTAVGFVLSMFYRSSVSIIAPQLVRQWGLTPAQLGVLSAAFFYAFAASQVPLGLALDRYGPRRVMTLLGAVAVAGAVVFALASSYSTAVTGRVLMGIGMSCNLMGTFTLMATWFPPERFATVNGLMVATGALGQMLAASPLAAMAETWGWQSAFFLIAAINAVELMALWIVVRDRPPTASSPPPPASPLSGLARLARMGSFWAMGMAAFFRYGCMMVIQGLWAGPWLISALKMDPVKAGNVLLAMALGYMIGLPLVGRLSDWLGRRKAVIAPSLLVMAILIASLSLFNPGASALAVGTIFFLLGVACAPGQIMYPHIKELVPSNLIATAMTSVNLFTMLGPAALMQATGWLVPSSTSALANPSTFIPVWLSMAAGLTLSFLAYLPIPDPLRGLQTPKEMRA